MRRWTESYLVYTVRPLVEPERPGRSCCLMQSSTEYRSRRPINEKELCLRQAMVRPQIEPLALAIDPQTDNM
jgi:hypothetical protein